jgi:glycosyltransferase involved in cell wall biosynthesis
MLLVFSDDWGRHPSSCQHLVQRLLARHQVLWVNTIGTRVPSFSLSTIRRGVEKIADWSLSTRTGCRESSNPSVLSPRMWPWFRRRHDRWLNEHLLTRAIEPVLKSAGEPVFAVTTIPIMADLIGRLSVRRWTYYCVDDFSVWPGLDQATMAQMERQLLQHCDDVIAVSENLVEHIAGSGRSAHLLPHGVDLTFWQSPSAECRLQRELEHLPRPLIVFWGVIDRRMNVDWIRRLSADLQEGTILLVGRVDDPDPALLAIDRVRHLPALPLQQLPALGKMADVLVMPYADLPVTRAMQPLKLLEYLATGKPVVCSDLPAIGAWSDCLDVSTSAEAFSSLVRKRLKGDLPAEQLLARERLRLESWDAKALQFENYVLGQPLPENNVQALSFALQS